MRDYKSAFENYKLFAKNKNSLFNDENITKLVTLQKDYDSSKKEYVKTSMEAKKKEKWFYIAGIAALLVIAGLLISQGKQRKKLDFQKLEIKRKEAEALIELDNIKSKFLYSISYELHTLLSLIKCNGELMRKGIHNVENEAYLSEIENNNEKFTGLINKLLSNAIKFTPKAGKIYIDLSLSDKKEDTIILKVKDNGIGIPIDQIANVFDIFHQNSAHQKFIGSDIGLSLVKELSVSHGGEVGVESVENKGGSFEVSLFFRNKESETLQAKVMKQYLDIDYSIKEISHHVLENIEERNLEKALVLVVENNPDITNFIKKKSNRQFPNNRIK